MNEWMIRVCKGFLIIKFRLSSKFIFFYKSFVIMFKVYLLLFYIDFILLFILGKGIKLFCVVGSF